MDRPIQPADIVVSRLCIPRTDAGLRHDDQRHGLETADLQAISPAIDPPRRSCGRTPTVKHVLVASEQMVPPTAALDGAVS